MTPVLEARNCTLSVHGKTLVREASLALLPGHLTVVVGANGAGKSTLLKQLSGEIFPSSGRVFSLGEPLDKVPVWRLAARRAVMAQASRISFPFPVHEVVRLGMTVVGCALPRVRCEAMIEAALARADVLPLAGRDMLTLSGGEQQRVHFARALVQLAAGASIEPRQALLLDEPVASLDLCHQISLLDALVQEVRGGIAGLAVLHDLNLAARFADHLVVMKGGRIIADGAPQDVLTPALIEEAFGVVMHTPPGLAALGPFVLPQLCALAHA